MTFGENGARSIKTKWIERASPLVVEKSRIHLRHERRDHFAELTRRPLIGIPPDTPHTSRTIFEADTLLRSSSSTRSRRTASTSDAASAATA